MITIYDRAAMSRVLTLDLDPRLRALLNQRFASLNTPHGDLTDWTEFLVIEPMDAEADIIREVGFSPLVEPIDSIRFGSIGFQPFWDHLTDYGAWFEMFVSFGSTFACVLYISEATQVATLREMCITHACSAIPTSLEPLP